MSKSVALYDINGMVTSLSKCRTSSCNLMAHHNVYSLSRYYGSVCRTPILCTYSYYSTTYSYVLLLELRGRLTYIALQEPMMAVGSDCSMILTDA